MTTFAHVGGGITVAAAVQHFVFKEEIAPSTILIGALFGLLPDMDTFFAFLFGKWAPRTQMLSHHRYFTHTPFFFIIVSGAIWLFLGPNWGLMFLAVTLTHLMMDSWSTDDGIMWLWPVRTKQYSLFSMNSHAGGIYGLQFYARYIRTPRLILPEIIIVAAGIVVIVRLVVHRFLGT